MPKRLNMPGTLSWNSMLIEVPRQITMIGVDLDLFSIHTVLMQPARSRFGHPGISLYFWFSAVNSFQFAGHSF